MKRIAIILPFVLLICIVIPTMVFAYPIGQIGGEPGSEFIYGDATGNDLVTADDSFAIAAYYVGLSMIASEQLAASEVNEDGVINIIDALLVHYYVGDYNSFDEKLIGTYAETVGINIFKLVNSTEEVWTDFHLRLDTYTSDYDYLANSTQANDYYFDGNVSDPAYNGPGSYTIWNQGRSIDILGLNIGVGETLEFSINYYDNGGYFGLFGQPTTTAPVPEPATMLLLGSGLIGLAGFSRKKFKK